GSDLTQLAPAHQNQHGGERRLRDHDLGADEEPVVGLLAGGDEQDRELVAGLKVGGELELGGSGLVGGTGLEPFAGEAESWKGMVLAIPGDQEDLWSGGCQWRSDR